jgi:hypothetical protein
MELFRGVENEDEEPYYNFRPTQPRNGRRVQYYKVPSLRRLLSSGGGGGGEALLLESIPLFFQQLRILLESVLSNVLSLPLFWLAAVAEAVFRLKFLANAALSHSPYVQEFHVN